METLEICVLNNLVNEGINRINQMFEDIKNLSVDFKWDSQNPEKSNSKYEKMRQKQDKGYKKVLKLEKRILKSSDIAFLIFSGKPSKVFFEKMAEIRSKNERLQKFVNA